MMRALTLSRYPDEGRGPDAQHCDGVGTSLLWVPASVGMTILGSAIQ
jgi:hypothetical protein